MAQTPIPALAILVKSEIGRALYIEARSSIGVTIEVAKNAVLENGFVVAGEYSPSEKRILLAPAEPALQVIVLTHELAHAVQTQAKSTDLRDHVEKELAMEADARGMEAIVAIQLAQIGDSRPLKTLLQTTGQSVQAAFGAAFEEIGRPTPKNVRQMLEGIRDLGELSHIHGLIVDQFLNHPSKMRSEYVRTAIGRYLINESRMEKVHAVEREQGRRIQR